jgi:cytoskeletal protein RodZ
MSLASSTLPSDEPLLLQRLITEAAFNIMSERIDIGEQLLKARENKNLTHAEIAHSTRITSTILIALENNDYSMLHASYARSFLRQYSEFLDVDASSLLDLLVPDEDITNISYLQNRRDRLSEKRGSAPNSRHRKNSKKRLNQLEGSSNHSNSKNVILPLVVVALIALIIAGGFYACKKYQPQHTSTATDSASTNELATGQQSSGSLEPSADQLSSDQESNQEDESPSLFDPISPRDNMLMPSSPSTSLEELAGLTESSSAEQDVDPSSGTSNDAKDDLATSQDSSPPPRAMVIDEGEE